MTTQHKRILWIILILAAAILGAIFVAGLAGWLGLAAAKPLKDYVEEEWKSRRQQEFIDRQTQQQLVQLLKEQEQIKADAQAQARAQAKEVALKVNKVQTTAELNAMIDAELDKAEGGFVRPLVLICGILLALIFIPIASSARIASPEDKARAARILKALKGYRLKIATLKKLHKVELAKQATRHRGQIQKLKVELRTCHKQKLILTKRTCPPAWPAAVATGGAVAFVCVGAFALREITR